MRKFFSKVTQHSCYHEKYLDLKLVVSKTAYYKKNPVFEETRRKTRISQAYVVAMSNDYPGLNFSKPSLSGPTWKVDFFLKSPISIVQRAYIPKNGVEFRQQSNGDNRTGIATSYDIVRRRQFFGSQLLTHRHPFLIPDHKNIIKVLIRKWQATQKTSGLVDRLENSRFFCGPMRKQQIFSRPIRKQHFFLVGQLENNKLMVGQLENSRFFRGPIKKQQVFGRPIRKQQFFVGP